MHSDAWSFGLSDRLYWCMEMLLMATDSLPLFIPEQQSVDFLTDPASILCVRSKMNNFNPIALKYAMHISYDEVTTLFVFGYFRIQGGQRGMWHLEDVASQYERLVRRLMKHYSAFCIVLYYLKKQKHVSL